MTDSAQDALHTHLKKGTTTVCRCWLLKREDGVWFGFTDHDRELTFDGYTFKASSGMDASALQTSSGLSVDNAEAVGALSDDGINENDILAGRYDGALVLHWLVNWADVAERKLMFQGSVGEISRTEYAFEVELRGVSSALNKPLGRVYMRQCDCTLGDDRCGVDLTSSQFSARTTVMGIEGHHKITVQLNDESALGDLSGGMLDIQTGRAAKLKRKIANDKIDGDVHHLTLEEMLPHDLELGDEVIVTVGCDRSPSSCKNKFSNFVNYRGFPNIPGEDWAFKRPNTSNSGDTAPTQNGPITDLASWM